MEHLINRVVDLDKEVRQEVEAIKEEKAKIDEDIKKEKERLEKQFQDELETKIEERRTAIAEDLKSRKKKAEKTYEKTLANINDAFDEKSDEWVDEIVSRCTE